jgi:hypothetical protein
MYSIRFILDSFKNYLNKKVDYQNRYEKDQEEW